MGFKLYRERMGDELYSKKMKEADEVCKLLIFKSAREMANGKFSKTAELISFLQTLECLIRIRETDIP